MLKKVKWNEMIQYHPLLLQALEQSINPKTDVEHVKYTSHWLGKKTLWILEKAATPVVEN